MELVELAGTGVKQLFMATPLVETERFKEGLARLDAELMAARALLEAQITRIWQNPERSNAKDMAAPGGATANGGLDHLGLYPRRRRLL